MSCQGVTDTPSQCTFNGASGNCDPRNIGLNSQVSQRWSKLPLPNDPSYIVSGASDGFNQQGYLGVLPLPQTSNFLVARIDHDFGEKWKFMSSYRYYSYSQATSNQTTLSSAGQVRWQGRCNRCKPPKTWRSSISDSSCAGYDRLYFVVALR